MTKCIFTAILSASISIQCLMCATVNMIVQHEENVTVPCNVNSSLEMAWYRLSSENITLLISALRGKVKNHLIIDHNEEKSHFQLKEDSVTESVSLTIISVGEPDIGLYYCAARIRGNGMRFGTPIRLTFAGGAELHFFFIPASSPNSCVPPLHASSLTDANQGGFSHTTDNVGCSTLLICAYAACGLCGIICISMLCYKQGSSADLCISCVKENSNSKAADMQYASLRFIRQSRAAVPPSVDVTYATVANRTS